jgi:hypothetical protein
MGRSKLSHPRRDLGTPSAADAPDNTRGGVRQAGDYARQSAPQISRACCSSSRTPAASAAIC